MVIGTPVETVTEMVTLNGLTALLGFTQLVVPDGPKPTVNDELANIPTETAVIRLNSVTVWTGTAKPVGPAIVVDSTPVARQSKPLIVNVDVEMFPVLKTATGR